MAENVFAGAVPGDRVVVRFARGPGAPADWSADPSARRSDVTGVLIGADDSGVRVGRSDGAVAHVPGELIVAGRILSDEPVRASEIRLLETAAAAGWPGVERAVLHGWLVRAGAGYTHRANSAVPLGRDARLDDTSVAALRAWFGERGLPTLVAAVERLVPAGHVPSDRVLTRAVVMTRDATPSACAAPSAAHAVELAGHPTDAWVRTVIGGRSDPPPFEVGQAVLTAVDDGEAVFATVSHGSEVIATGRGAVTASDQTWLGVSCLWTAPAARGRGLGAALVTTLLGWGHRQGAHRAYLQVEHRNANAIRLYRRLGFGRHHTYDYAVLD